MQEAKGRVFALWCNQRGTAYARAFWFSRHVWIACIFLDLLCYHKPLPHLTHHKSSHGVPKVEVTILKHHQFFLTSHTRTQHTHGHMTVRDGELSPTAGFQGSRGSDITLNRLYLSSAVLSTVYIVKTRHTDTCHHSQSQGHNPKQRRFFLTVSPRTSQSKGHNLKQQHFTQNSSSQIHPVWGGVEGGGAESTVTHIHLSLFSKSRSQS